MSASAENQGPRPDPLDRIADHALREAHGLHAHPDLTPRIVAAWQRGERGTDVTGVLSAARLQLETERARLDVELESDGEDAPSSRRWLAAAASVLFLGVAALGAWWWSRPQRVAPIARSDAPLRVFRAGEAAEILTNELRAGDVVLTGTGEVAWLDLAADDTPSANPGGRIVLGPCSLLAAPLADSAGSRGAAGAAWSLGRGRIEASGFERAFALDAGFARLVASPASTLRAEMVLDDAELVCSAIHGPAALGELLARLPQEPRTLRISVERGGVELDHDGLHETLAAGAERELGGPANPARLVSEEGKKEILKRLDYLRSGPRVTTPQWTGYAQRERELVNEFAKHLEKSPQYWPVAREEIVRRTGAEDADPAFVRRCADLALLAPEREGIPLARALWQADPGAFTEPQIVTLAERGLFEFEREARAQVELYEPGAGPAPLWAAAWLAGRGDERARTLLANALDAPAQPPFASDEFDAIALAAFTLDHCGDPKAWRAGLDRLTPEIERELTAGMFGISTSLALELRYLDEARRRRELVTPARLLEDVGPYIEKHQPELADLEALNLLLEGLRK